MTRPAKVIAYQFTLSPMICLYSEALMQKVGVQKIFCLGVICTHMVGFCKPSHIYNVPLQYHLGFGSEISSEALPHALPKGQASV